MERSGRPPPVTLSQLYRPREQQRPVFEACGENDRKKYYSLEEALEVLGRYLLKDGTRTSLGNGELITLDPVLTDALFQACPRPSLPMTSAPIPYQPSPAQPIYSHPFPFHPTSIPSIPCHSIPSSPIPTLSLHLCSPALPSATLPSASPSTRPPVQLALRVPSLL